nr:hypothetical protein [Tanacetum cinerariifolium]
MNSHTFIATRGNVANVAIPLDSIRAVSERFANTAYGFFLGKRVAYPAFSSKDGFDATLKNGPWCSSYKVFGRALDECPKKIVSDVMKNLNNPRQATRSVPDGPKPLPKVVFTVNANSDSEVKEVFDEHETFIASTGLKHGSDSGDDTISLWEQWKETKRDDNYDPYDDYMYDNHDMSDNIQAICEEFDITVRVVVLVIQIIERKLIFVDDDGKPLPKVVFTVNANSDSEVKEIRMMIMLFTTPMKMTYSFQRKAYKDHKALQQGQSSHTRTLIYREGEVTGARLLADYFGANPKYLEYYFRPGANNNINVLANSLLFDDFLDDIALVAQFEVNGVTYEKAGANNNINVLANSPLFDDFLDDIALVAQFEVNGVTYEK